MQCLYPISIPDKRYAAILGKRINVPCGTCVACHQSLQKQWIFRLYSEMDISENSYFITLTYDEEHLPWQIKNIKRVDYNTGGEWIQKVINNPLDKRELIRYFKRLRKVSPKMKYFAVGEYGTESKRPHYHAILYNVDRDEIHNKWKDKDGAEMGRTHAVVANEDTIAYCTKYLISPENEFPEIFYDDEGLTRPFRIMSKGLGKSYVNEEQIKFHNTNKEIFTKNIKGVITPLPRYIREKIFSEEQLRVLNKVARERAKEKFAEFSYEDWLSIKKNFLYIARKKSKSK